MTDLHQATFSGVMSDPVRDWADRHVRTHLGHTVDDVLFRVGHVGAVFGLRLDDGNDVVLKAIRDGNAPRLRAVVAVQTELKRSGFRCPAVLDGPSVTDEILAVVEERIVVESTGSPHDKATRVAMAESLAEQIAITRSMDGSALVDGRPAWANWDTGAWPVPHDPIFEFTAPAEGFAWVDETANKAAAVLRACTDKPVVGHSDWVWQNVCVRDATFVAGYDWDSLVFAPESAIIGMAAGAFTQGSTVPPDAPSDEQVAGFIEDYQVAAGRRFTSAEQQTADAAATWVRCYSARCQLDNLQRRGMQPPEGSFFDQLAR